MKHRETALQVATRLLPHLQVTQMAARQTARDPERWSFYCVRYFLRKR